ncbi:hypothetical protein Ccar_16715 [Clostridium carboxidivorans P7]|uniref:hypothetical protein n=1 Tax=Clostridium carboxidivorans TaxID=217159 RepID=UPI00064FAD43|nr:hypothetical protein [Clostridium carboxidivorans]AKN32412.1 hypothetical protein Ccar_16715 [Clostridium carboxidivorans P7]
MLAYWGKKRKLVNILRFSETGAVELYELEKEPGNMFIPLIVDGKNVEPFEIVENEQISMF